MTILLTELDVPNFNDTWNIKVNGEPTDNYKIGSTMEFIEFLGGEFTYNLQVSELGVVLRSFSEMIGWKTVKVVNDGTYHLPDVCEIIKK